MKKEVGRMDQSAAVIDDRSLDGRVVVSKGVYADATEQVEIAPALLVDKMHALASHKEERIAFVRLQQQPRLGGFDLVEFRHFIFSSGHHHFGAVGYARTAQVGKGTGSLGGQKSNALPAGPKGLPASAPPWQQAPRDEWPFWHFRRPVDGEPS